MRPEPRLIPDEVPFGVYSPGDDSMLLVEAIDFDGPGRFLDLGCGSGIVGLHAAALGCRVVFSDSNLGAVRFAVERASRLGYEVHGVASDMLQCFRPHTFDCVAFNPPYLPESPEDVTLRMRTEPESDAWFGGRSGRERSSRFVRGVLRLLASQGSAYLVTSSLQEPERLARLASPKLDIAVVAEKHLFFECLKVVLLKAR